MRVAIISTNIDSSPKILRQSLGYMLRKEGVDVVEISDPGFLTRLFPLFGAGKKPGAFHFRLRRKIENYIPDNLIIRQLRAVDAIIFSTQCPNGFWRYEYAIEDLRKIVDAPVVFHEVYYLGNTPGQQTNLRENGDPGVERYDWHLAVTPITAIHSKEGPPWSVVGLNLEEANLHVPEIKKKQAIVDFPQPGYDRYRNVILQALERTGFEYIELRQRMPMEDIRELYRQSSILFLSFPEAFGVPIAECLACGTAIFSAEPGWPMSWNIGYRNADDPGLQLPSDCFWIYNDQENLEQMLNQFLELPGDYGHLVRNSFLSIYPEFYFGNQKGVREFLHRVEHRNFT